MMEWLSRLFGRSSSSAEIAKNRLKVVLSYDRTNLTPEMLNTLQEEIVRAISQHLEIDRAGMMVSTQRGENGDHLIADIPIRSTRTLPPPRVPGRATKAVPSYSSKKKKKKR